MSSGEIFNYIDDQNQTVKIWDGADRNWELEEPLIKENTYHMHKFVMTGYHGATPPNTYWVTAAANRPSWADVFGDNENLKLINKVVDKTRQHSFNLGVALGESRETLMMAEETLKTVGGVILDLRHGQLKDAARKLGLTHSTYKNDKSGRLVKGKTLQDRWLEFQWGWKPAFADIQEAAKATAIAQNKIVQQDVIRTSVKKSLDYTAWFNPFVPGNATATRYARYYMTESDNAPRSFAANMGLDDPFSIAWELIPLSVVFDYFLPIGDYLQAIHGMPTLDGALWYTDVIRYSAATPSFNGVLYYDGSYSDMEGIIVDRYQVSTSGLSAMDIPLPKLKSWEEAISPVRFGNLLALTMSSAFGTKPPRKSSSWTAARSQYYRVQLDAYNKTI